MPAKKLTSPRNPEISKGLNRFGRHASYARKGVWAVKKRSNVQAKKEEKKAVVKPFGKKGATRTVGEKQPKFYPTEDVTAPARKKSLNVTRRTAPLRTNITPGTVLILLTGKHQGRRVVFLKQLPSGLLLVTGPYKINGVPLRRVDQAFVIATSTKVDISSVKVDAKFTDAYFAKKAEKKTKKGQDQFFASDAAAKEQKPKASADKVADQKAFDALLLPVIKKTPQLEQYLGARFRLQDGDFPHELKF